jgi:thioredoxin 1
MCGRLGRLNKKGATMKKLLIFAILLFAVPAYAGWDAPAKGMVTMADIGSTNCIPCKMMDPVLKNLRGIYKDRAAVVFIDVNKHSTAGRHFGISAIPTQIFYDNKGVEKWRHVGFLNQEKAAAKLDELLGK